MTQCGSFPTLMNVAEQQQLRKLLSHRYRRRRRSAAKPCRSLWRMTLVSGWPVTVIGRTVAWICHTSTQKISQHNRNFSQHNNIFHNTTETFTTQQEFFTTQQFPHRSQHNRSCWIQLPLCCGLWENCCVVEISCCVVKVLYCVAINLCCVVRFLCCVLCCGKMLLCCEKFLLCCEIFCVEVWQIHATVWTTCRTARRTVAVYCSIIAAACASAIQFVKIRQYHWANEINLIATGRFSNNY